MSNQQQPDIEAIKARLAKATPGEWFGEEGREFFLISENMSAPLGFLRVMTSPRGKEQARDDIEFLLAAHNTDIPSLLSRLEAVEKALDECAYALFQVKRMGVDDTVWAFCIEHYDKAVEALFGSQAQQDNGD